MFVEALAGLGGIAAGECRQDLAVFGERGAAHFHPDLGLFHLTLDERQSARL